MSNCFRCGHPTSEQCVIGVHQSTPGVGSVSVKVLCLSCECCEPCYQIGKRVDRLRYVSLLLIFGLPALLLAACLPLYKGESQGILFFGFTFVDMLIWIGTPIWFGIASRPLIASFLGAKIDEALRKLSGTAKWTFTKSIKVYRKLPRGVSAVPLRSVIAQS